MAQETPSTVENPQGDTTFTQILQKLQEYDRKASEQSAVIKKLQEQQKKRQVQQQKEQDSKEQNVVKKLPTVLTTNQKKRYAEIGKRFLLGAEQQFRQIKKGVKMKQMMKTSKDYFLKGFEKIKEEKENKKKKSFWKTLFASLIVIGFAAYLFRDKIAKMMPNLSQQAGGLFKTIKNYLGNMIKGCWDYITKSLGGSITAIFQRIFTESIPSILQVFFFETLPNAIFNTYLAVMSQFDPRANEILGSGVHDPQTQADIVAATAEGGELDKAAPENRQIDAAMGVVQGVVGVFNKIQRNERVTQEEISLMQSTLGRWMLLQNRQGEAWSQTKAIFEGAEHLLGTWTSGQFEGGELYRLMKDGEFDWQLFLRQFLSSDRTAQSMSLILKNMFSGKTEEQRKRLSEKYGINFDKDGQLSTVPIDDNVRSLVANKTMTDADFSKAAQMYSTMTTRLGAQWGGIIRDDNRLITSVERGKEDRMGYMYDGMGYVSLQLLRDATVSQVNNFVKSIDKFVNQSSILGDLKDRLKNMVQNMSNFFNQFFIGSLEIMKNILYGILTYTPAHDKKNKNNPSSENNTIISNEGGVLINVDLTGNEAISIATAFQNIVTVETQVLDAINSSISSLQTINRTLQTLDEMHSFSKQAFDTVIRDLGRIDQARKDGDDGILELVSKNSSEIEKLKPKQLTSVFNNTHRTIAQTLYNV